MNSFSLDKEYEEKTNRYISNLILVHFPLLVLYLFVALILFFNADFLNKSKSVKIEHTAMVLVNGIIEIVGLGHGFHLSFSHSLLLFAFPRIYPGT